MLCGALALIVITFLSSTTTARVSALNDQHTVTADELLVSAQQEILAKLSDGFSIERGIGAMRLGHVAAGPGLLEVRRYDLALNRGAQLGAVAFTGTKEAPAFFSQPFSDQYSGAPANPRWIPLFSWTQFAPRLRHLTVSGGTASRENADYNPALSFNLNTPSNPFMPGVCLLSGLAEETEVLVREKRDGSYAASDTTAVFTLAGSQTSAERPVWVQWVPVLKNPAQPPSAGNPVVGRYAYWVDVENTKLRADQTFTAWRDLPQHARLLGEPDAVDQGDGSWIAQSQANTALTLRREIEAALPPRKNDASVSAGSGLPLRRDGAEGIGFSASSAHEAREAWLGWIDGAPPAASGTHVIDWDYFEAPWPRGQDLLTVTHQLAALRERWASAPASKPLHPWFIGASSTANTDPRESLLRQVAISSLTFEGYEEDVDPLGLPKLDLVQFQLDATGGRKSIVSLDSIRASAAFARLTDNAYHGAYFPANWSSGGAKRSFADTWKRFTGDGASSGEPAVLQMLANIAEFAQPATVPPLIDTASGIVGARSMPYVAEVTTRARSAMWLLPESDRNDPAVLLKRDAKGAFTYTYKGKRLQYYATHVIIELCVGFLNPNPFETDEFSGEIEFDIGWGTLPSTATKELAPFKATLIGRYTATPEPGKDPKVAQAHGNAAFIKLATVPSSSLNEATPVRIKGWKITRNNGSETPPVVWHQVPVKNPGGRSTREWWRMAELGAGAGSADDTRSLRAFQDYGQRAVGWFAKASVDALIEDTLFVKDWTDPNKSDAALASRVTSWATNAKRATLMERIVSHDPVLGHRTGDPGVAGLFGKGHFYGALGHTWRRQAVFAGTPVPVAGKNTPEAKLIEARAWEMRKTENTTLSVNVQRPEGGALQSSAVSWPVPRWASVQQGKPVGGEYLTQAYASATDAESDKAPKTPEFLTAIYLCPAVEGPAPQGQIKFDVLLKNLFNHIPTEAGQNLAWADVETKNSVAGSGDWIKSSDGKKGPRSLFCSAPAGRPCVSVGEIGFVHSGFPQMPIIIAPDEGATDYQLNSPRNGPPMRMLLDIFKPRQVVSANGRALSESEWLSASNSATPRRAWNVNTTIAHDDYMALREGGVALVEPKSAIVPTAMPAHAVWLPNAVSFARRAEGSEAFRAKEARQVVEKNPGYMQDRHLRPGPAFARPWNMWLSLVGGDCTPSRSGESSMWGVGNMMTQFFGAGLMTWEPGKGAQDGDNPWVDFNSEPPAYGRLLAFGVDGRGDNQETGSDGKPKANQDGWLKGRFAADHNRDAMKPNLGFYVPAHYQTRHALFPMRHFISDLAVDFQQESHESNWSRVKTALNPGLSADELPAGEDNDDTAKESAERMDGAGFPGGWHQSGVFYNAPMALLSNQAGVSANAFTAYVVVQAVRDKGQARAGITKSGPGYVDPDDTVLAERWARVLIRKEVSASGAEPKFKIIAVNVANR